MDSNQKDELDQGKTRFTRILRKRELILPSGGKKDAQRTGRRSFEKMTIVGVRSEIKQKKGKKYKNSDGLIQCFKVI